MRRTPTKVAKVIGECQVCHKVGKPTNMVYLGLGNWRHVRCFPGSATWVLHYPANHHTPEGDIIYAYATKTQGQTKEHRRPDGEKKSRIAGCKTW